MGQEADKGNGGGAPPALTLESLHGEVTKGFQSITEQFKNFAPKSNEPALDEEDVVDDENDGDDKRGSADADPLTSGNDQVRNLIREEMRQGEMQRLVKNFKQEKSDAVAHLRGLPDYSQELEVNMRRLIEREKLSSTSAKNLIRNAYILAGGKDWNGKKGAADAKDALNDGGKGGAGGPASKGMTLEIFRSLSDAERNSDAVLAKVKEAMAAGT